MSLSLPSVCMCVCARGCARCAEWKIDGFLPAVVVFFFFLFFFAGLFRGNVSCRRSRLREGVRLCVCVCVCLWTAGFKVCVSTLNGKKKLRWYILPLVLSFFLILVRFCSRTNTAEGASDFVPVFLEGRLGSLLFSSFLFPFFSSIRFKSFFF